MRPLRLLFLMAALLPSAAADAQGCWPCGGARYGAPPAYVVLAPAPVVARTAFVAYAGPGIDPCLACAAMAAFPPPAGRLVYDLRTGVMRITSPW